MSLGVVCEEGKKGWRVGRTPGVRSPPQMSETVTLTEQQTGQKSVLHSINSSPDLIPWETGNFERYLDLETEETPAFLRSAVLLISPVACEPRSQRRLKRKCAPALKGVSTT